MSSGQRNGPAEGDPAHHTHCSACVAAAALYLGINILRPSNHPQLRFANAQIAWLAAALTSPTRRPRKRAGPPFQPPTKQCNARRRLRLRGLQVPLGLRDFSLHEIAAKASDSVRPVAAPAPRAADGTWR